jgi:beta-lactamase superfamily II metal-dependent hydrolase
MGEIMKRIAHLIFTLICSFILAATGFAQMKIHHINVGQADSTLLEFKTAAILIDAGGASTAGDPDRAHLREYLDRFFASRPDLHKTLYSFIITHPHIDHTRYIMDIMQQYRVLNFVDNGDLRQASGSKQVKDARAFIKQNGSTQKNRIFYNDVEKKDIGSAGYTTS